MKLREVVVKNFRNLADVRIPISDTTILVGENNSGKTAFLDALTVALPKTGYMSYKPVRRVRLLHVEVGGLASN